MVCALTWTTLLFLVTSSVWQGGVLADNGLIYAIPNAATSVAIIHPKMNTVDTNHRMIV
eukprot:m.37490 g.37490  ORF g.37490 m.37490 type:complete len:59 (+) comp6737_c1_seq1:479-655(+)